jgi:hypothetical protein
VGQRAPREFDGEMRFEGASVFGVFWGEKLDVENVKL